MLYPLAFDATADQNHQWRSLMAQALDRAEHFRIHCWAEETAEIDMALDYGRLEDSGWPYGKVISGAVTPEFRTFLLGLPKPADTELYNKMTPFFSIFLDDRFSSEHYGTELYGAANTES